MISTAADDEMNSTGLVGYMRRSTVTQCLLFLIMSRPLASYGGVDDLYPAMEGLIERVNCLQEVTVASQKISRTPYSMLSWLPQGIG